MRLHSEHPFFGADGLVARKHVLDNGLCVILLRDPSAPLVALQTWLRVGSRNETPGKTGMAHLFEHLMFNESEGLAQGEFDRRMEALGADTNAATWVDWTYYRENLPKEHLAEALALEAERFAHLVVRDPQVASEKEVVANERMMAVEDDVEGFLGEELHKRAFTAHPYHWPTLGWMEDIRAFTTDDARRFYRTWYAPNNATVVVVGDLDEDATRELVQRHYGDLDPSELPPDATPEEPPQEGPRRAVFDKPVLADRLLVGWRACTLDHADAPAVKVAVDLLAGGQSSRLHRRLVIETEVASTVQAHAPEFRDPGLIELSVAIQRRRRAAEAEAVIDEEIERLAAGPLDEEELSRARHRLEARLWRGLRPQEGKAESLGHWETTVGDYRRLFSVAAGVQAVGADDVRRVLHRYMAPDRRTTVIAEPGRRAR